jgi:hypothetical protein
MISLGPPNPQPDPSMRFHYYRDIFSLLTLDLNTIITDFDLKTWGFLVYPGDYDEQANPFEFLIRCVLLEDIIPLAAVHFASFFSEELCWILALDGTSHWNLSSGYAGRSVVLSHRTISPSLGSAKDQQFPSFGPFEQGHGGPSAEFFEKSNRICYMWMPRSNGVHSPPDSPESSLLDLFGSTSASSSIASVADGVARARVNNDSVEMDTTLVHIDMDGMLTSVCLGPDGTINSISQIFSSYTDCHPVLFKNHFCLSMGDDSTDCMAASSVHGLGFSPACTERAVSYASAPCEEYEDGTPVQRYAKLPPVAWAYYAKGVSTRLMKQAKGLDPVYQYIGIGSELRNGMPDTGHFPTLHHVYWIYRKWKRV